MQRLKEEGEASVRRRVFAEKHAHEVDSSTSLLVVGFSALPRPASLLRLLVSIIESVWSGFGFSSSIATTHCLFGFLYLGSLSTSLHILPSCPRQCDLK
jgi:hypothetical protein